MFRLKTPAAFFRHQLLHFLIRRQICWPFRRHRPNLEKGFVIKTKCLTPSLVFLDLLTYQTLWHLANNSDILETWKVGIDAGNVNSLRDKAANEDTLSCSWHLQKKEVKSKRNANNCVLERWGALYLLSRGLSAREKAGVRKRSNLVCVGGEHKTIRFDTMIIAFWAYWIHCTHWEHMRARL